MEKLRRMGLDTGGEAWAVRGHGASTPSSDSGTKKRGRGSATAHGPAVGGRGAGCGVSLADLVADGRGEALSGVRGDGRAERAEGHRDADGVVPEALPPG